MTADDVTNLLHSEIAGRWNELNDQGVDVRQSLTPPTPLESHRTSCPKMGGP